MALLKAKIFVLVAIFLSANALPVFQNKGPIPSSASSEEDLDLSPKLLSFLERLLTIDPKLIETGELRLEERQRFGINQLDEILAEATAEERSQFFLSLDRVEKLYEKHPMAKELIENLLATSGSGKKAENKDKDTSSSSSEEFYEFFKEFSAADKELSKFPEWNQYWNIWFKKHVDYMTKYG